MGLLDGYSDPQVFADSGGMLGRLLSLRPDLAQNQQHDAGLDHPPAIPQAPPLAPAPWPASAISGPTPFAPQPAAQDLHSQYQALRPLLGDYGAMLATVHPEVGQSPIAQALANQQGPRNIGGPPSAGDGRPVVSDASPDPIRLGSQYAQAPMRILSPDPLQSLWDQGPTAGPPRIGGGALSDSPLVIGGGLLLGGLGAAMLMHPGDKPESNRLPSPFPGHVTPPPPISLPGVDDWWNEHAPVGEQPQNYIYSRSRQGGWGDGGDPDPDDEECKKQKADALDRCSKPWENNVNDTGPFKKESGEPWNTDDCIRGFVSEKCGGNKRDYTPGRRKRKRGRLW